MTILTKLRAIFQHSLGMIFWLLFMTSSFLLFSKRVASLQQVLHEGRRGGGQLVSVLAFYSDVPSLNPAEAYS